MASNKNNSSGSDSSSPAAAKTRRSLARCPPSPAGRDACVRRGLAPTSSQHDFASHLKQIAWQRELFFRWRPYRVECAGYLSSFGSEWPRTLKPHAGRAGRRRRHHISPSLRLVAGFEEQRLKSIDRGARTHDHKVKSFALYRLSWAGWRFQAISGP